MRTRFTEGRTKEVLQMAAQLYEERKAVRHQLTHHAQHPTPTQFVS